MDTLITITLWGACILGAFAVVASVVIAALADDHDSGALGCFMIFGLLPGFISLCLFGTAAILALVQAAIGWFS